MKMKKMMLLMLTLLIWGTASMNAQVTIGSEKAPHSGAILDLQSDNLGLKLPNVALDDDLTVFKLPVTDTSTAADAKGMYVYNTNPKVGEGVYVWDGGQWLLVKGSIGEVPVTSITLAPTRADTILLEPGESLQLRATVSPSSASNQHIVWSITTGQNIITVDQNGLVTMVGTGRAIVRATASNGIYQDRDVYGFSLDALPSQSIGGKSYHVYHAGGLTWMAEFMKSVPSSGTYATAYNEGGTADANTNGGNPTSVKYGAYYYDHEAAATLCPAPWRLPTDADMLTRKHYENSWLAVMSPMAAIRLIRPGFRTTTGTWRSMNETLYLRSDTADRFYNELLDNYVRVSPNYPTHLNPVQCVKNY